MKKIFLVILSVSSLLFLGCKKTTESPNAAQVEILSQDTSQSMEKIKTNLERAKETAKSWHGNAQLYGLVLKISSAMKENTLTETFVFGSPDDSANWWTYSISEQTGKIVRAVTPKEDYFGTDFQPIKEEYLKTAYIEAIKTAESAGGTAFRAKNVNSQINVVLAQTNPNGWLWWQIEYQSADSTLRIFVNAADGKIYDENGQVVS